MDEIQKIEEQDALYRALMKLSVTDRRLIVLRLGWEGEPPHTFREMAEIMGISENQSRDWYLTAIDRLRVVTEEMNI